MSYSKYRRYDDDFSRALIKGKLGGKTTRFLGHVTDAFKAGMITRRLPPSKIMQTEKTWRTCRRCLGGHTAVIENINGLLTEQHCLICGGKGVVFN